MQQKIITKIEAILVNKPEAYNFIVLYSNYSEVADDAVDEPKDIATLQRLTDLASKVFTCNYWHKNGHQLYLVHQVVHMVYFNSVQWEKAPEDWKRRDAKALSHCGYYMLFAVLLLETGDAELVQKLSIEFMERNHLLHINDPI